MVPILYEALGPFKKKNPFLEMHGVWAPNLLSYSFSAHSFHGLETWLPFTYFFFQTAYFQQREHICKESRTMSLPQ